MSEKIPNSGGGPEVVVLTRENLREELRDAMQLILDEFETVGKSGSEVKTDQALSALNQQFDDVLEGWVERVSVHTDEESTEPVSRRWLDEEIERVLEQLRNVADEDGRRYVKTLTEQETVNQLRLIQEEIGKYLSIDRANEKGNIYNVLFDVDLFRRIDFSFLNHLSFTTIIKKLSFKLIFKFVFQFGVPVATVLAILSLFGPELISAAINQWYFDIDDHKRRFTATVVSAIDDRFDDKGEVYTTAIESIVNAGSTLSEIQSAIAKLPVDHLSQIDERMAGVEKTANALHKGVTTSIGAMAKEFPAVHEQILKASTDTTERIGTLKESIRLNTEHMGVVEKDVKTLFHSGTTRQTTLLKRLGSIETAMFDGRGELSEIVGKNAKSLSGRIEMLGKDVSGMSRNVSALTGEGTEPSNLPALFNEIRKSEETVVAKLETVMRAIDKLPTQRPVAEPRQQQTFPIIESAQAAINTANDVRLDALSEYRDDFKSRHIKTTGQQPVGCFEFSQSYFQSGQFAPTKSLEANAQHIGERALNLQWQDTKTNGKMVAEGFKVAIIGHADEDAYAYFGRDNCWLSKQRATWFADILVNGAAPSSKIFLYGMSDQERIYSGKSQNRRIEVFFSRSSKALSSVIENETCSGRPRPSRTLEFCREEEYGFLNNGEQTE